MALLQQQKGGNPPQELPTFNYIRSTSSHSFNGSLPKELDTQLRDLKTSISTLEKRPIVLKDNYNYQDSNENALKTEINKLNKEILGLQSDLYKLNSKYISKGLLSPEKTSFFGKNGNFITPQRNFPLLDSEITVKPDLMNYANKRESFNNLIDRELQIFTELIIRKNPRLFQKYFDSTENVKGLAQRQDYASLLLPLLQMFNETLQSNTNNPPISSMSYKNPSCSQVFEAETKQIDFKNYFKNSYNEHPTGILKKHRSPQNVRNQKEIKSPREVKTPGTTIRKNIEDSTIRESRYSSNSLEGSNNSISQYRLYNNRSESERFLQEEQGLSIDDINHKKKVKPVINNKKKRNVDIITNLPKRMVS